jgi:hypothetical protein
MTRISEEVWTIDMNQACDACQRFAKRASNFINAHPDEEILKFFEAMGVGAGKEGE